MFLILLPSAMKLRRLCFYRRLSVHRGEYLTKYTPPGPGTPSQTRYTLPDQVHPPGPGTPPRPGTPPGQGTPPRTRYTPQDQVHLSGPGPPPRDQVHSPGPGTPPPPPPPRDTATAANGTHPTGMHSCSLVSSHVV